MSRCPVRRSVRRRFRTKTAQSSVPTRPRTVSPSSMRAGRRSCAASRRLGSGRVRRRRRAGPLVRVERGRGRAIDRRSRNRRVLRTVDVGGEPEGVRLRPDRKTVYVTSESDHAVSVIDTESGALLDNIPSAGALAIRFSPPTVRVPSSRPSTAATSPSWTSRRATWSRRLRFLPVRCRWGLRLRPTASASTSRTAGRGRSRSSISGFAGRRDGARRRAPVGYRAHRPTVSFCTRPMDRRTTFRSLTPHR